MQFSTIVASTIACAAAVYVFQSTLVALFLNVDGNSSSTYSTFAQDLPNPCTYTATPCGPIPSGPTEVITVYEDPLAVTATSTFDCQGCSAVTVVPKACFGLGLPITTTSFTFVNAPSTTTVDVCSETPATVPTDCPDCLPPK